MLKIGWDNIKAKLVFPWLRSDEEKHWIVLLFILVAALFLLFNIIFFFINLNSTLNDHSWGDISFRVQYLYNFVNGRPLQASIYGELGHGTMSNPYPYISPLAYHTNFTPYLFTPIYFLYQNVNMLYLIIILFNYIGMSIMIWKIIQYKRKSNYHNRLMLALSLFFISSAFFMVIIYKGQEILFLGPFLVSLYYFFIRHQYFRYLVTAILICLISEDTAAFLIGWAIYLILFERSTPHIYKFSLSTFLVALFFVFVAALIIQPAARYHLVAVSGIEYTGHASESISRFISIIKQNLAKPLLLSIKAFLLPLGEFIYPVWFLISLPVSYLMFLMFGYRLKVEWGKICGLIFVAPITHIIASYFIGGSHHLMPVYVCILLSLVLLLSSDLQKVENKGRSGTKLSGLRGKNLYLALTGLLLLFIVLSNGAFVGANVLKGMKSIFNTSQEKTSNIATINYIGEIPSDSSVVYWTNRTAEAFIVTRSDIWRFPNYFDKADYLVIQKNVNNSFYEISHEESVTLLEAIGKGSWGSSGDIRSITLKDIEGITRYLVYEKKTHEVVADNKYIIAFEKIKKETFEMPYFTIGVGWARDIPKVLERYKIW